jgi:hypothetical protein
MAEIAEALEVPERTLHMFLRDIAELPRAAIRGDFPWTKAERELLEQEYPDGNTAEISRRLRRTAEAVRQKAFLWKIYKTAAWHARDRKNRKR